MGVSDYSITSCYRIRSSGINSGKSRPIIVKFENAEQRNMVYYNKNTKTNIVISEELTKCRYKLLMLAREKLGKKNVWSTDGKIYW